MADEYQNDSGYVNNSDVIYVVPPSVMEEVRYFILVKDEKNPLKLNNNRERGKARTYTMSVCFSD